MLVLITRLVRGACAVLLTVPTVASTAAHSAQAETAASPTKKVLNIVQLGDSYSSGTGADEYYGVKGCYRSLVNWGQLFTNYLNAHNYSARYDNAACHNAKIKEITTSRILDTKTVQAEVPGGSKPNSDAVFNALTKACVTDPGHDLAAFSDVRVVGLPTLPKATATGTCVRSVLPQMASLTAETDLVLMTMGGNDVNFHDIVYDCFVPGTRAPGKCRDLINTARTLLPKLRKDLTAALLAIHAKLHKDARVIMLTYPYLSSRESWILRSFAKQVSPWGDSYDAGAETRSLGDAGDSVQRAAVADANKAAGENFVTLIDKVKNVFAGHEPDPAALQGNSERWISEMFKFPKDTGYHPNLKGQEAERDILIEYGGIDSIAGSPGRGSVDMAFVIDTTGSMQPSLDSVKRLSNNLVDLLAKQTDSYRFALVTYRDQPMWTHTPIDYASRVNLPFTTDTKLIHSAISALKADGGGDGPESVYSGLEAAYKLHWRPGVKKVVIQIGDAPPHDPEPVSGYTEDTVVKDAIALDPAEIYPIDVSGLGLAGSELPNIAARTGGVPASTNAANLGSTLITTITKTLRKPSASAGGPYLAKVGDSILLDAGGSFDPDGSVVTYEWDFDGDGKYDEKTTTAQVSHAWTSPIAVMLAVRVTDNSGESSVATAPLAITVDGDNIAAEVDNCPNDANPGQGDYDKDGIGDECDTTSGIPMEDMPGVFPADNPAKAASAEISGSVYIDRNDNKRRDGKDDGVSGVTITLSGADGGGGPVSRQTTSDESGAWSFGALLPGTYSIAETQPPDLRDGADSLGALAGVGATGSAGVIGNDTVTGIVIDAIGGTAKGYGFSERKDSDGVAGLVAYGLVALLGLILAGGGWYLWRHRSDFRRRPGSRPASKPHGSVAPLQVPAVARAISESAANTTSVEAETSVAEPIVPSQASPPTVESEATEVPAD